MIDAKTLVFHSCSFIYHQAQIVPRNFPNTKHKLGFYSSLNTKHKLFSKFSKYQAENWKSPTQFFKYQAIEFIL